MTAPVVTLTGVSQRYGATVALEDIDLEVPAARMVGLIGLDGVGKSSLMALVAGARVSAPLAASRSERTRAGIRPVPYRPPLTLG